ncbi:MAG TPA: hypothetical protein VMT58_05925, partial [Candidatus Binataceae bacterium]|nr:hypothetical protein [Candidatus Binataceae bacterium]
LIPFTLALGVLAGFGIDVVLAEVPRGKVVGTILISLAIIDCWRVSTPFFTAPVTGSNAPIPVSSGFRQSADPSLRSAMFRAALANTGVISCYENIVPEVGARGYGQPGYRNEQYLLGPGTVRLTHWSTNELQFRVDAREPTELLVNQNYDLGWMLAEGSGQVNATNGLIAVKIPAGEQHLTLAYRGNRFYTGLWITLGAIAALILLCGFELKLTKAKSQAQQKEL